MGIEKDFRCVQFVPYEIVHRAAIEMAEDKRRYEVWLYEFEQHYNVKFGSLKTDIYSYTMIFPSDQDYTAFMLRWA